MTDLEMTRLCASAMGIDTQESGHNLWLAGHVADILYDPINDDEQAMALVKKFRLQIDHHDDRWNVAKLGICGVLAESLNRAIVECVASHPLPTFHVKPL